jgi:glutaredoxin
MAMKRFIFFLSLFLMTTSAYTQAQDIEVFEKKDGNKNIVIARNTGKVSYLVTLKIEASGMDITPGMNVEAVVPGGYMKEMATLTPRPGAEWSYGYEVSFIEYIGELPKTPATSSTSTQPVPKGSAAAAINAPSTAESESASIIVYTQTGCGRCAFVKKEMKAKGIVFKEIDVNSGTPEVNTMWMQLREGGFTGDSVTMPVVKANGKLHYNIKDLAAFVHELEL